MGGLLERDEELQRIGELLDRTRSGSGTLLVVEGEAGIGKTALLDAAAERAGAAGLGLARARGSELERTFGFGVARQLLEPLAGRDAIPEGAEGDVLHRMYWRFAELAAERPLLVAVDDAHWSDLASLRALAYLARRVDDLPLLLAVATRPGGAVPLAAEAATTLTPGPLSREAVAALAGEREAEAVHGATGGVPFLVREMVRGGDLGRSVVARIRRLGALEVARAIAVLGADAQPRTIGAIARTTPEDAARLADELAAEGLVTRGRPVEFVHAIVRAAVEEEIPPGERSRLHAQAAALMLAEGAAEERVAAHLLATDAVGDPATVALLVRSATGARERGAPDSAIAYLRRALAEPLEPPDRSRLLRDLGTAETAAGAFREAAEHLQEALRLAPGAEQRAAIARDLVSPLSSQGRHEELMRVLAGAHEAVRHVPELSSALQGEMLLVASFEPSVAPLRPEAAPVARPARGHLAALTLAAAFTLEPAAEVVALARRAREAGIAEEVTGGGMSWANVLFPLMVAGDYEEAERMLGEGAEVLRRRPSVLGSARVYAIRSYLQLQRGALREAVADARTSLEAGRGAGFMGWPVALGVLVEALVELGEPEAAEAALAETGLAGEMPDTFMHLWALAGRARLRPSDHEELRRRAVQRDQRNPALFPFRSGLALAHRDPAPAEEELELARTFGAPRPIGVALRALAVCRGGDVALLRESIEVLAGSGAALEHARSLVELGAALRRAGRRAEAREPLHAGMEQAHGCGASPLVEQARAELLATGARPRRIMRTGVDALTPSELRVARLAATGLTNREIAQELFVTGRTVETHLTQVFRKLGAGSRAELPALLG